jgi:DNA-binding transcriptional LysR family regulator
MVAGSERSSGRLTLTVSAPPIPGEVVLRPIVDSFLREHPQAVLFAS